jgi:hypothetical protein
MLQGPPSGSRATSIILRAHIDDGDDPPALCVVRSRGIRLVYEDDGVSQRGWMMIKFCSLLFACQEQLRSSCNEESEPRQIAFFDFCVASMDSFE